jgi:hypothetical protein
MKYKTGGMGGTGLSKGTPPGSPKITPTSMSAGSAPTKAKGARAVYAKTGGSINMAQGGEKGVGDTTGRTAKGKNRLGLGRQQTM